MAKIRRSGLALPPGLFPGEVLTWDGVQWGPQALPPPPAPQAPVNGDILIYNTITNTFTPASMSFPPTGARGMYEIESFIGQPDGTLVTAWPAVQGSGTLVNAGGAERPSLITSATDGIRAMRFNGVANFLRLTGLASPAVPEFTVFIVAEHHGLGVASVPWSLGRVGAASNAAGCARGIMGIGTGAYGFQAQNIGGAVAQSAGFALQDGGQSSTGIIVRRAYAFQCTSVDVDAGFMALFAITGDACAFVASGADQNMLYTAVTLGGDFNAGGAMTLFDRSDISYFAHYSSAVPLPRRVVWMELQRLRSRYLCY